MKKEVLTREELTDSFLKKKGWGISRETVNTVLDKSLSEGELVEKWGMKHYDICVDVFFNKVANLNTREKEVYLEYIKMNNNVFDSSQFLQNYGLYISIVVAVISVLTSVVGIQKNVGCITPIQWPIVVACVGYFLIYSVLFLLITKQSYQVKYYGSVIDYVIKHRMDKKLEAGFSDGSQ